jgi:hypothetical protein
VLLLRTSPHLLTDATPTRTHRAVHEVHVVMGHDGQRWNLVHYSEPNNHTMQQSTPTGVAAISAGCAWHLSLSTETKYGAASSVGSRLGG